MSGEKKSFNPRLGMGISTILVFFVILSLTTLATLSLVSANADKALSRKAVEASVNYYDADSKAEEILAVVDTELKAAAGEKGGVNAYYTRCVELVNALEGMNVEAYYGDGGTPPGVRFSVPVNDFQELVVILELSDPASGGRYTLSTWKVVNTVDWDMESGTLDLWQLEDGSLPLAGLP